MRIRSKLAALAGGLLLVGMTAAGGVAYADDHDDRYDIPQAVLDDLGETDFFSVEGGSVELPIIAGLWYEAEDAAEDAPRIFYSWARGADPEGNPVSDKDGYTNRAELQAHIDDVCANDRAGGGWRNVLTPLGVARLIS